MFIQFHNCSILLNNIGSYIWKQSNKYVKVQIKYIITIQNRDLISSMEYHKTWLSTSRCIFLVYVLFTSSQTVSAKTGCQHNRFKKCWCCRLCFMFDHVASMEWQIIGCIDSLSAVTRIHKCWLDTFSPWLKIK